MTLQPPLRSMLGALVLVLGGLVFPSSAQPVDGDPELTGERLPSDSSFSTPSAADPGIIELRVARFGVGGRPRPGDWFGVQIEFLSHAEKASNVLISLNLPDPDGDTALLQRSVVPNPGVRQSVWLYGRLPFFLGDGHVFTISAHEALEADAAGPGDLGFVPGKLLGQVAAPLRSTLSPVNGLIATVGQSMAALNQYPESSHRQLDYAPTGHELTELVRLGVPDLPDRWMGLLPLEAIVWTGSGATGTAAPADLTEGQADAIREWINRGGHFVIVLPSVGQTWLGQEHLLAGVLPMVEFERIEGADLSPYQPLLNNRPELSLPTNAVIHVFHALAGAGPYDAMCVLEGPLVREGEAEKPCIVVRRVVGHGAVTLVGLDVASSALTRVRAVEADRFWNRVLGKRLPLLTPDQVNSLLGTSSGIANRRDRWYDSDLGSFIARQGSPAAGLFLALIVFACYWVLAGPLGYFVLRKRGLKHFSWLGFVSATGAFTAIAWGGANLLKQREVDAQHLTVIDHVFGQPIQRSRTWMELFLPAYGEQRVSVAKRSEQVAGGGAEQWHHLVTAWDRPSGPGSVGGDTASFPDARPYAVDARSPGAVSVPSRATTKQFQVEWAGPPREGWQMPMPTGTGASEAMGDELVIVPDASGRGWQLTGSLTHKLPGALQDVCIIVNPGQADLATAPTGAIIRNARAFFQKQWAPGETLDLPAITAKDPGLNTDDSLRLYLEELLGAVPGNMDFRGFDNDVGPADPAKRFAALSLFSLLHPPPAQSSQTTWTARRQMTHALDLSRWLTQPCIIIIGQMPGGAPSPTPIYVDDQAISTKGHTVVRWIYPLPADPPGL